MGVRLDAKFLVSAALLIAVLLATHLLHWALPDLFEPLAAQVTDRLFALRSSFASLRPTYDDTVVHVVIDDRSLRERFDFYLDRPEYAQITRNLGSAVAAQLHDAVFAAPLSPADDLALAEATAQAGTVFFGMALGLAPHGGDVDTTVLDPAGLRALERERWPLRVDGDASSFFGSTYYFLTFPELSGQAAGMGFLDIVADKDGIYRRAPLLARDGDRFIPSLPFLVVCRYLGVSPDRIRVRPGRSITLEAVRPPGETRATDIVIPIDHRGRMIVNFIGPWGRMTHYPAMVVHDASDDRFELEDLRSELAGRIAVVSTVATGHGDIGPVPTDAMYPLSGIHANVIHGILTQRFLRQLTKTEMLLWIELPLLVILLITSTRMSTVFFVPFAAGLGLLYHLFAGAAFLYANLIVNIPRPVLFLLISTIVVAAYDYHLESRARAVLRSTFDAYFPPSVVDKIMAHSAQLTSTAQKKELTILFSDIASFTRHTAHMEAAQVRRLLNEYFERMIEIVFEYEGTLDKFIGDGLMVFFGDPQSQPDHAVRCARAAIEMQTAARELDRVWSERGDMPLRIRIGINTGEVIVGNMGSRRRLSYTALGEPVNVAQRLEASAPVGGILVSERTRGLFDETVPVERHEPIRVKGIDTPVAVYEIPVGGTG